jgi:hypothetical protein
VCLARQVFSARTEHLQIPSLAKQDHILSEDKRPARYAQLASPVPIWTRPLLPRVLPGRIRLVDRLLASSVRLVLLAHHRVRRPLHAAVASIAQAVRMPVLLVQQDFRVPTPPSHQRNVTKGSTVQKALSLAQRVPLDIGVHRAQLRQLQLRVNARLVGTVMLHPTSHTAQLVRMALR